MSSLDGRLCQTVQRDQNAAYYVAGPSSLAYHVEKTRYALRVVQGLFLATNARILVGCGFGAGTSSNRRSAGDSVTLTRLRGGTSMDALPENLNGAASPGWARLIKH